MVFIGCLAAWYLRTM